MKFGAIAVAVAEGAILAHSARLPGRVVKKGTKLTADDIDALTEAGIRDVIALRLDPDDIGEDTAADKVARTLAG